MLEKPASQSWAEDKQYKIIERCPKKLETNHKDRDLYFELFLNETAATSPHV